MPTDNNPVGRVLEEVAEPDTVERVHLLLSELLAAAPVNDMDAMQFELALAEIAANIIEHAKNADGGRVSIRVELEVRPDSIVAKLSDDGEQARVDLKSVELPDELSERGRGLAIALTVLDELSYRRAGHRNQWTLVRNRTL
ncbi:ATP-binding protein [Williamsia sp. 1135]|uniref:ATP-binding protein n=1 Tax=Williamsia sp. 1135 TaxID=1889262 RepID=UPI000A0FFFDE|nr:ATP-binding protein [Williamsia sp. 1135]ORM28677.1 ATP-binding protein [Williamsia sp. 1135]